MKQLAELVKSNIQIDDEALKIILSNFKEHSISKGKFILKEGRVATEYIFVKSGGLRIYFNNKDKQVTAWVALENNFFTELSSLKNQTPSRFTIQAIEDTVLLTIKHGKMEALYNQFPQWQEFGRKVWEMAFLGILEGIINYKSMTAEERYLETMKQPALLEKIPLKHLSSYLGITPTSLSRLRKNIK